MLTKKIKDKNCTSCLSKDFVYTKMCSFQLLTFMQGGCKGGERSHVPSKSACGPHEDLRHHRCTRHLYLHRPQAAGVQRSSGQNNEGVSTSHHTLKKVKRKKTFRLNPRLLQRTIPSCTEVSVPGDFNSFLSLIYMMKI